MWDLPSELRLQAKSSYTHCGTYLTRAAPGCVQLFTLTKHLNISFAASYTPGSWTGRDIIPKLRKKKVREKEEDDLP